MSIAIQMLRQMDIRGSIDEAAERGISEWNKTAIVSSQIILQNFMRQHVTGKTIGGPRSLGRIGASRGNLARSIQIGALRRSENRIEGPVGTNSPYAAIHEHGGVIRPKNAQYLTIPIHSSAERRRASDFPDLFVYQAASGKAFLVRRTGKGGALEIIFLLLKSVIEQARRWASRAIEDATGPIVQRFGETFRPVMRKALGHGAA